MHTKTMSNLILIYISSKVIRKVPMIDFLIYTPSDPFSQISS